MKQGSLALSSEISSFTTLRAYAAVRSLQAGLLPELGPGGGPPARPGGRATRGIQPHAQVSACADAPTQHFPSQEPLPSFQGSLPGPRSKGAQTLPAPRVTAWTALKCEYLPCSAPLCPPRPVDGEGRAHPTSLEQGLVHSRPQQRRGRSQTPQTRAARESTTRRPTRTHSERRPPPSWPIGPARGMETDPHSWHQPNSRPGRAAKPRASWAHREASGPVGQQAPPATPTAQRLALAYPLMLPTVRWAWGGVGEAGHQGPGQC